MIEIEFILASDMRRRVVHWPQVPDVGESVDVTLSTSKSLFAGVVRSRHWRYAVGSESEPGVRVVLEPQSKKRRT